MCVCWERGGGGRRGGGGGGRWWWWCSSSLASSSSSFLLGVRHGPPCLAPLGPADPPLSRLDGAPSPHLHPSSSSRPSSSHPALILSFHVSLHLRSVFLRPLRWSRPSDASHHLLGRDLFLLSLLSSLCLRLTTQSPSSRLVRRCTALPSDVTVPRSDTNLLALPLFCGLLPFCAFSFSPHVNRPSDSTFHHLFLSLVQP